MYDLPPEQTPTGRDVAAAWVVCALIGAMALGLTGNLHGTTAANAATRAVPDTQVAAFHDRYPTIRP
jgi:hypothetical protein